MRSRVANRPNRLRLPSSRALAMAMPLVGLVLCSGCDGAMWGNLAVFAISVGIFMGTLSLGRH